MQHLRVDTHLPNNMAYQLRTQ